MSPWLVRCSLATPSGPSLRQQYLPPRPLGSKIVTNTVFLLDCDLLRSILAPSLPVTSLPVTSLPVTSLPMTSLPVTSLPVTSLPVTTEPSDYISGAGLSHEYSLAGCKEIPGTSLLGLNTLEKSDLWYLLLLFTGSCDRQLVTLLCGAHVVSVLDTERVLHNHTDGAVATERVLHSHTDGAMDTERVLHSHTDGAVAMDTVPLPESPEGLIIPGILHTPIPFDNLCTADI